MKKLVEREDFDCQITMYFRISGIAPPEWDSWVRPVLVFRPGGLDLGNVDMDLLSEWINHLTDMPMAPLTTNGTPRILSKGLKKSWAVNHPDLNL